MAGLQWVYLGQVSYHRGLLLQEMLRQEIRAGRCDDTLLLLEHPKVITLGKSAARDHVLCTSEDLERRGIGLVRVQRGGQVTYHGPGQLVGYPIRRIGRRIRAHIAGMAHGIICYLGRHGVVASYREEMPGIWTRAGKIAALGIDARFGVAIHGFALNVDPDLADYRLIVPCGAPHAVTSMGALRRGLGVKEARAVSSRPIERGLMSSIAEELAQDLARAFKATPRQIRADDLGLAGSTE
jgi:lipoyl(octanoyl) transferase